MQTTLELNSGGGVGVRNEGKMTPNHYFQAKFPSQTEQFGPAFLELRETSIANQFKISPISINLDFFAAIFSDPSISLSVVYFEPEMQFYYNSAFKLVYQPVSPEKLQNLYRGFLIKCAQALNNEVNIFNLFHEFRSDKVARQVTSRAKSVLACDSAFFSATSPYQRICGPELHERLIRVVVETMLERSESSCLTVTQAYQIFCKLSQQRSLSPMKRSMFKATMQDLVKDVHGLGLRRDVPDQNNRQQEAWKGLKFVDVEVLGG